MLLFQYTLAAAIVFGLSSVVGATNSNLDATSLDAQDYPNRVDIWHSFDGRNVSLQNAIFKKTTVIITNYLV